MAYLRINEDELTVRIHSQRPVNQIQIQIVQPQPLQTRIQRLLNPRVICAPQLSRHEQILALDLARGQGVLNALADFLFVLVAVGTVDVPVAHRDGMADGFFDLAGGGLPGSCGG